MNTRDIGLAIRDAFEGQTVMTWADDRPTGEQPVDFVDVSDPNNPVLYLRNGARFQVRIFCCDNGLAGRRN